MTLYTIGCFHGNILKYELGRQKTSFNICRNLSEIEKLNLKKLPILEVSGKYLNFNQALKFIEINRRMDNEGNKK